MNPDSYYSHGFLIPIVSGFLIWQKRRELKEEIPTFSAPGLFLIITGMLAHITGTILYIFSVSGFSILLLIVGFVLFVYGKSITRIIWFPLLFIIFMIPLPLTLITMISFPLKMLVAKMGVEIVRLLSIPVYREGFNITIPAGQLLVGNPCSGLRSLIAFLALGSIFAYLSNISNTRKCVLFLSAIPIAILSNIVRVPILIVISHYWGLAAASVDSFWHDASGIFVFIVGLFMLFYGGRLLEWKRLEIDT